MPFEKQRQVTEQLGQISHSFERLSERLERAYTLIGDGHTLMRNLLDAVPCGILIFDSELQLSYANQVAKSLLENVGADLSEQGSVSTKTLEETFQFCQLHPGYTHTICHLFQHVINQEAVYLNEVVLSKEDDSIFLEVWINPEVQFFDQQHQKILSNTLMLLLDITERKKIEQVLQVEMKMQAEFNSADRILQALLPDKIPQLPNFEIVGRCIPASAIGGDFYDWYFNNDQHLIFTLGDVMGKEMSAALLMTTLRSALRTTFNQGTLETVLAQVSVTLLSDFEKLGSFATVFYGRLDPKNHYLTYVCAGHTCGLILRTNGKIEWLEEAQLPLGIVAQEIYQSHECQFSPGDCLILYTRGIFRSFPQKELEKIAEQGYVIERNEPKKNAVAIMEWFFQQTEDQGQSQDRTVLVLNCLT